MKITTAEFNEKLNNMHAVAMAMPKDTASQRMARKDAFEEIDDAAMLIGPQIAKEEAENATR